MDDGNQNVRHPLLSALKMFEVAARSAFDTAAAFWRLWSGKREKQEAAAKQQQSNAPSELARQPIKRDQGVTVGKKPKAPTKREIAKAISAKSNGGENAQGADKALVETRAGTGA